MSGDRKVKYTSAYYPGTFTEADGFQIVDVPPGAVPDEDYLWLRCGPFTTEGEEDDEDDDTTD